MYVTNCNILKFRLTLSRHAFVGLKISCTFVTSFSNFNFLRIMELTENKLKQKVQRNILMVSVLILVGKFLAYYLTNSVGVLTDAMESIVNVAAGTINLFSL